MDNQADVPQAGPVGPDIDVALLAAVDALAFPAVLALDEAHGTLVTAGAATRSPPSDQWYRLIEQLTAPRRLAGAEQQRRLCVGAAAFLAAEAHHIEAHRLEEHCATGQTGVLDRLNEIADQVRDAADALLSHAENLETLIPSSEQISTDGDRTEVENSGRSAYPWLLTAALGAVYGILGNFITTFAHRTFIIVLLFIIGPGFVVLRWHLQARHPHHLMRLLRTPRSTAGWSDEIMRHSGLLDVRAAKLHDLLRRIHLVAGNVAAQRRACESHGILAAAAKLDSLGRLLHDASEAAEYLTELVADGREEARRFTASCRRDPREACSEYGRLPLLFDPERVGAVIDSLVLVLRLAGEVAVDIPLHIQSTDSRMSTVPAGKVTTAVESMFREFQGSGRSLKNECRSMLRSFDMLHCLVTAESISRLERGLASRMTARAAVAATVVAQPLARRPAVRTAFVREASASSSQSWVWIGKATAAAITRGQQSLV